MTAELFVDGAIVIGIGISILIALLVSLLIVEVLNHDSPQTDGSDFSSFFHDSSDIVDSDSILGSLARCIPSGLACVSVGGSAFFPD